MSMRSGERRWLLAAVVLASACGDDDGASSPADATPGADTAVELDAGEPAGDADADRDAGPGGDAGPMIDPSAARWVAAPEPAEGPLMLWGYQTAAIDAHRGLLFGGTTAGEIGGSVLADVWLYDSSSGDVVVTAIQPSDVEPAPRYCGCAAWDPDRERLVIAGGRDLDDALDVPVETWELDLDGPRWTRIDAPASPPGVVGCSLAYSSTRRAMYAFGGASREVGTIATTYRYEPETPAWIELAAEGPVPRYDAELRAIRDGAELLLFAGSFGAVGAAFYSDVWRFDVMSETWTEVSVAGEVPPGRRAPWMVLRDDDAGFWMSMGYDGAMQPIRDLWYFDLAGAAWTAIALSADGPPARGFARHLPGPPGTLGLMLSGFGASTPLRDAWFLTL